MIPLAIRRHSLQDLTLGQSTLLKVPSCEERQIRRAIGVVNAERTDGMRLKTLRTPDGLRVWLVECVEVADSTEWKTGKSAVYVFALGGGGGGGGGGIQTTGSSLVGASGGPGASPVIRWMAASTLSGTVTVTIGDGGAGGTATSGTVATNPTNGNAGGQTSFGTAVVALGALGANHGGGANKSRLTGVGIAEYGQPLEENSAASAPGRTSDEPDLTVTLSFGSENFGPGDGGSKSRAAVRALTKAGGGGGGGQANNNASDFRAGGAGARGFGHQLCAPAAGGTAASPGAAGENGGAFGLGNGGAGGGPGNAANVNSGAGGNGYLGGGGGGGASAFRSAGTVTSGAGGAGGGGYVLVISV